MITTLSLDMKKRRIHCRYDIEYILVKNRY